jgi:hypothetical protein
MARSVVTARAISHVPGAGVTRGGQRGLRRQAAAADTNCGESCNARVLFVVIKTANFSQIPGLFFYLFDIRLFL